MTKEIKECINEYFNINDNGDVSQSVLWDSAKDTIRGEMIEISSRIKKKQAKRTSGSGK